MMNYLNLNKKLNFNKKINFEFIEEELKIENIDYYYSNVISRSSKTMAECRNIRQNIKKTGTEG